MGVIDGCSYRRAEDALLMTKDFFKLERKRVEFSWLEKFIVVSVTFEST